jgi:hypothetical protein
MIEVATYTHTQSGDRTISGTFPGKTPAGTTMSQAITFMRAKSDRLIVWPIFPGKTGCRVGRPLPARDRLSLPPAGPVRVQSGHALSEESP